MKEIFAKLASRKLWLIVAATVAVVLGAISEETWRWVAVAYLAGQGYADGRAMKVTKPEKSK